jgi:hypothetical protein
VKEGVRLLKVNDALSDMLDAQNGELSETQSEEIASKFGSHAREQAERMIQQRADFATFSARAASDPDDRRRRSLGGHGRGFCCRLPERRPLRA